MNRKMLWWRSLISYDFQSSLKLLLPPPSPQKCQKQWPFANIIVLVLILLKRGENCPQSIPTVAVVDDCPQNTVEWVKRMELKKCNLIFQNCTTIDNFEYHCLTNKFQHIFVEVCAPNKMIVGKEYH